MQILDYEGREDVHVCLSCDTEFTVRVLNEEEALVEFCPSCGSPLDDEDLEEDEEEDDFN